MLDDEDQCDDYDVTAVMMMMGEAVHVCDKVWGPEVHQKFPDCSNLASHFSIPAKLCCTENFGKIHNVEFQPFFVKRQEWHFGFGT